MYISNETLYLYWRNLHVVQTLYLTNFIRVLQVTLIKRGYQLCPNWCCHIRVIFLLFAFIFVLCTAVHWFRWNMLKWYYVTNVLHAGKTTFTVCIIYKYLHKFSHVSTNPKCFAQLLWLQMFIIYDWYIVQKANYYWFTSTGNISKHFLITMLRIDKQNYVNDWDMMLMIWYVWKCRTDTSISAMCQFSRLWRFILYDCYAKYNILCKCIVIGLNLSIHTLP